MVRLTLILCGAMFVAMLIGGQDRGQIRFGLVDSGKPSAMQIAQAARAAREAAPAVSEAVFTPVKPLMTAPAVADLVSVAATAEGSDAAILQIAAQSANVRQGPGKDYAIVGTLGQGEPVLVVEQSGSWSLIKIEGDGVEGYVATRLLSK